jgi:hypothetical protein
MAANPTFLNRMLARFQGEVPATTLEAYRRASLPVFELLDQVEARRLACAMEGLNPWTIPPATRTEFLCAWNAFVLQTLGNDILDADYAEYPATAGFVPPPTGEQVMAYYSQVEAWLNRAQQAHANPDFQLDVSVPADLPPWVPAGDHHASHLLGVLQAMRAVGDHAAAAVAFLPERAPEGPEQQDQQAQLNRIRQLYASAQTKARYASDLHGTGSSPEVHERLEPYAREAIELYYQVGQLVADPTLTRGKENRNAKRRGGKKGKGRPLPGQPGFDEWVLTDPDARARLKADPKARKAIQQLWNMDPRPERTLAIHSEIQSAFDRGDIGYAMSGRGRIGHYYRCPWGPVYVAKRNIMLGGTRVSALLQFVFEVGGDPRDRGKPFQRRVTWGAFHPTEQVAYNGPGESG